MVAEQFLADADGERAGAVERANDERMEISLRLSTGESWCFRLVSTAVR
jgi:hypothetical protein